MSDRHLRLTQGYEKTKSLLHRALEGRQRKLGGQHPACFESAHELAALYKVQGLYGKSQPLPLEAVEGRRLQMEWRRIHQR